MHVRLPQILDDPFESNGQFCRVQAQQVLAQARSDGYLASAAEMSYLLRCCSLYLDAALAMPRAQLYSLLAPKIAADPHVLSAAAALLRSANVRYCVLANPDATCAITEDAELESQALCSFLVDASHRSEEDHVAIYEALASEELESHVSRLDVLEQGLLGSKQRT